MSFDMTSTVTELKGIKSEIVRLNAQIAELRKRKKELDTVVTRFLDEKKQRGFKFKGTAVFTEEKTTTRMKKKSDREKSVTDMLRKMGVQDAERAYQELQKCQKQEAVKKELKLSDCL